MIKNFLGRKHSPSPDSSPGGEGDPCRERDTPSPHLTYLGTCGTSL